MKAGCAKDRGKNAAAVGCWLQGQLCCSPAMNVGFTPSLLCSRTSAQHIPGSTDQRWFRLYRELGETFGHPKQVRLGA